MIIAEISQNFHNLDEAKELTRLAHEAGADLVKAQLFGGKKLYGKNVPAELSFEQAKELFEYGKSIGAEVFFSVFDVERIKWCEEIGVKRYKIAYSQRNKDELFGTIPSPKEVIVSIDEDTNCNERASRTAIHPRIRWLYCVPRYPAQINEYMLNFFWFLDGISDHTVDTDCAKIAIAQGASIIEKHFAIDHETGVDAPWSMTAEELKELKRWKNICKQVL